jgi:hypothetical protein
MMIKKHMFVRHEQDPKYVLCIVISVAPKEFIVECKAYGIHNVWVSMRDVNEWDVVSECLCE